MPNKEQERHRLLRSLSSEGLGRGEDVNRGIGFFLSSPYHPALKRIQTLKYQLFSNGYEDNEYNELVKNHSLRDLVIERWDNSFKDLEDDHFCVLMKFLSTLDSEKLLCLRMSSLDGNRIQNAPYTRFNNVRDCLLKATPILRSRIEELDIDKFQRVLSTLTSTGGNIETRLKNADEILNNFDSRDSFLVNVRYVAIGGAAGAVAGAVAAVFANSVGTFSRTLPFFPIGGYAGMFGGFLVGKVRDRIRATPSTSGYTALDSQSRYSQSSAGR